MGTDPRLLRPSVGGKAGSNGMVGVVDGCESGLDPVPVGGKLELNSLSKVKAKAGCTFSTPGTLWRSQHEDRTDMSS